MSSSVGAIRLRLLEREHGVAVAKHSRVVGTTNALRLQLLEREQGVRGENFLVKITKKFPACSDGPSLSAFGKASRLCTRRNKQLEVKVFR